MKTYYFRVNFRLEDFWFDDYEFEQTEDYFLEKLTKIIDDEMKSKYGKLYEGSCYQTLLHLVDTEILQMEDLIEIFDSELKDMCINDIEEDCIATGAYDEMVQEAREYAEDQQDWFGTKNDVLGL